MVSGRTWFDGNIVFFLSKAALKVRIGAAKKKAVADDLICAELGHIAPDEMAAAMHPLTTKSY